MSEIKFADIPLSAVATPEAPDRTSDELKGDRIAALRDNIKAVGQVTPIVVYEDKDGNYHVIAGKRRIAAMRQIKGKVPGRDKDNTIRALIRAAPEEGAANGMLSIVSDNFFNAPPSGLLQGRIFKTLLENGVFKNQGDLAEALGISQSLVSKRISYTELPSEAQEELEKGELPASVASVSRKKLKGKKAGDIKRVVFDTRFTAVPADLLIPKDGGEPLASLKASVSKKEIRLQFTLSKGALDGKGLLYVITKEIEKIGQKELTAAIRKHWQNTY